MWLGMLPFPACIYDSGLQVIFFDVAGNAAFSSVYLGFWSAGHFFCDVRLFFDAAPIREGLGIRTFKGVKFSNSYDRTEPCPLPLAAFVEGLRGARRGFAAGPSGATNEHMRRTLCACMRLLSGLPRQSSRRPSWMRYELGGSWPCASRPAESEPSLSGTCCGAWLDGSWLRLSPPNSSKLVNPSSLGSARELELRRSPVSYALQPRSARVPRCCRSMQLGHLTMCPGLRCWRRCMRNQRYSLSSHMPDNSTPELAATCGRTTKDAATRSAKLRAASKGTPSCPGCTTPWPRTVLCKLSNHSSGMAKPFLPSWTTSTSLLHLSGSSSCMSTSRSPWGARTRPPQPLQNQGLECRWRGTAGHPGPPARGGDPVWVGDWALPQDQQDLVALGTPLGTGAFVQCQLRIKRAAQDQLLERIPHVDDLQASWLLWRYCAAPRANYLLRVLPPALSKEYAAAHDTAVARYLAQLLGHADAPPRCRKRPREQPSSRRGLGDLACVARGPWASWCDALPVVRD